MKKTGYEFIIFLVVALLLLRAFNPVSVFAAEQDNLEVQFSTDKEEYDTEDPIKAVLTVKNSNEGAVSDIELEIKSPYGYNTVEDSENKLTLENIKAGETVTLESSFSMNVPADPEEISEISDKDTDKAEEKSSDKTMIIIAVSAGAFLIIIIIIILLLKRKKKKKSAGDELLAILLCITLSGMLLHTGKRIPVKADEARTFIEVSTTVKVNGRDCVIKAQVGYYESRIPGIQVDVMATENGSVNDASGKYCVGDTVSINAIADDGAVFTGWEVSEEGLVSDTGSPNTVLTVPGNDCSVVAKFEKSGSDGIDVNDQKRLDEADVELACAMLLPGYSKGDYENSVTNSIVLPNSYGSDEHKVDISWSSSDESIISVNGVVTRPTKKNKKVTLTAELKKGEAVGSKEFTVRVIRIPEVNYSDVEEKSLIELEELNTDSEYPLEVEFNDDGTQISFISGTYSEVPVNSVESALNSLYSVKSLIGLSNPMEELEWVSTNHDGITLAYTFRQIYMGYPVYGAVVTLNADPSTGKVLALSSSIVSKDRLSWVNFNAMSYEDIVNMHSDVINGVVESSYEIYAQDYYANYPVLIVRIKTEDEIFLVSANDGSILKEYPTRYGWGDYSTTGSGYDELNNYVSFPVQFHQWDWWFFYQEDIERKIFVHGDKASPLTHEFNTTWNDKTANSAYTNVIKVFDWYKSHLGRNSIDGNGMAINVHVHDGSYKDNAFWSSEKKAIYFCDNSKGGTPTTSAGLDIIAHEMTHGVFDYVLSQNGCDYFPYVDYTGAINEGYADIFGYFADSEDWLIGEDWRTLRSLADPESYNAPARMSSPNYATVTASPGTKEYNNQESRLVHTNSSLVYHAAYLMYTYGITGNTLEKLWYNSMSQGYDASSDFKTVRRNLIQAAKNLHFSDEDMAKVRKAFDEEEIYDERGTMSVVFVDANGNVITNLGLYAGLELVRTDDEVPTTKYTFSSSTDYFSFFLNIYYGDYSIKVSIPGYVDFVGEVNILKNQNTAISIPLLREGTGLAGGVITSATTGYALDGVSLKLYEGWNVKEGTPIVETVTGSDGKYLFELQAGNYTLQMDKEDYSTGYLNIIVEGGKDILDQNASISPNMTYGKDFRVVLTWGYYPSDLDSHLYGQAADGSSYHIFYSNKNGYDNSGNLIANLDVDDTSSYGPETTTFTTDVSGEYEYYIDWYAGSGTWGTCQGKVEVYNGDRLIYVFDVPNVDDHYGSWKVFTIKNGIFTPVNIIQSTDIF